ncbi:uncharacterized protein BJ212DRAFT_1482493 [Suillus subaureus]|uniref:Uncharacterized protein n=1 Tax=Suillus subaureus TaxID=48587 RepID=A0A9P7JC09_9AGAM|nr:uncharacterized protein BJ212DRAFT_1482493 [Suillus subaureus]KAG1813590.1 hypothetical protein BJ212DRAFT_1482493 [Suillus subaureus]
MHSNTSFLRRRVPISNEGCNNLKQSDQFAATRLGSQKLVQALPMEDPEEPTFVSSNSCSFADGPRLLLPNTSAAPAGTLLTALNIHSNVSIIQAPTVHTAQTHHRPITITPLSPLIHPFDINYANASMPPPVKDRRSLSKYSYYHVISHVWSSRSLIEIPPTGHCIVHDPLLYSSMQGTEIVQLILNGRDIQMDSLP